MSDTRTIISQNKKYSVGRQNETILPLNIQVKTVASITTENPNNALSVETNLDKCVPVQCIGSKDILSIEPKTPAENCGKLWKQKVTLRKKEKENQVKNISTRISLQEGTTKVLKEETRRHTYGALDSYNYNNHPSTNSSVGNEMNRLICSWPEDWSRRGRRNALTYSGNF